ncbi:MAG TPA: Gfo/Idh/MocA family oxidoreductase [Planctomycetota bacterium]|nr:Gfo/Idh/MocA family oxidoreductase [Planctomycetota bacterium]
MKEDKIPALNWGILGTGNIAKKFAKDLADAPNQKLVAVGSRTQDAASAFGAEFNVPARGRYGSYDAVLADPTVQCVYISMPNHMHREWAIKCANAKKHILCEKPIATNLRETHDILEAVTRNDVFMMEAFMYRCHPQCFKLRELIESGIIGEVRMIHGHFSYDMTIKHANVYKNIRMSNPMAGGALMDVGCYPVSFARLAAGCEPIECKAVAQIGAVSRVDEWTAMSLKFPNGAVASLSCGMQVAVENTVSIFGSEGSIHFPTPWFGPAKEARFILKTKSGLSEEFKIDADLPLYAIEAVHVAEHIDKRQAPAMTWADSVGNMATLDTLRKSIGLVFDGEK